MAFLRRTIAVNLRRTTSVNTYRLPTFPQHSLNDSISPSHFPVVLRPNPIRRDPPPCERCRLREKMLSPSFGEIITKANPDISWATSSTSSKPSRPKPDPSPNSTPYPKPSAVDKAFTVVGRYQMLRALLPELNNLFHASVKIARQLLEEGSPKSYEEYKQLLESATKKEATNELILMELRNLSKQLKGVGRCNYPAGANPGGSVGGGTGGSVGGGADVTNSGGEIPAAEVGDVQQIISDLIQVMSDSSG